MARIVVDIEADGPIPGDYSMVSFGAVLVDESLSTTFYGRLKPISDMWLPQALAVSGHTRGETLMFPEAKSVMEDFAWWLKMVSPNERPIFFSDNLAFDWMFICWYFHHFLRENPFGHSGRCINDLYKGWKRNMRGNPKKLRKTKHTHHPVDDAMGNAEALLAIWDKGDFKR